MSRPKPVAKATEADYPTLSEFAASRRRFVRQLAIGALAVGSGGALSLGLSGCDTTKKAEASPDPKEKPEEEMRLAGAAPEPELLPPPGEPPAPELINQPDPGQARAPTMDMRLPADGWSTVYTSTHEYLSYAIALRGVDPYLQHALQEDAAGSLAACAAVLAAKTCETLGEGHWPVLQAELMATLKGHAQGLLSAKGVACDKSGFVIEKLEVIVHDCYLEELVDGDMPAPMYPGDKVNLIQ